MALTDTTSSLSGWRGISWSPQLSRFRSRLHTWRIAYQKHRTEKMLEALPYDVRKDLGWPDSDGVEKTTR